MATPTTPRGVPDSNLRSSRTGETPSFVWVTIPDCASSHQAELLDIRADGYLVKWSVNGKEALISLDSVLQQELPQRTRRPSNRSEAEGKDVDVETKKRQLPLTPLLKRELNLDDVFPDDDSEEPAEDEAQGESEKEEPPAKDKKPKISAEVKTEVKTALWKSQPRGKDGKFLKSPSSSKRAKGVHSKQGPRPFQNPSPDQFLSLFKLHRLVRTKTEARVAALLEEFGYAQAGPLVAEFFLFCNERQSCWQRRNNEDNPIWSDSPILQNYYFGNVYRQLDRGTCYVRSQFTQQFLVLARQREEDPSLAKKKKPIRVRRRDWIQKLLWTSYVYRQVNQMEPFLNFGGIPTQDDLPKFLEFVADIQEQDGETEDSFFACTYPMPSFDDYQFHLQRLHQANGWLLKSIAGRLVQCRTVKACWEQLGNRLPGMANYPDVAWQVLCDLIEAKCLLVSPHQLAAFDWIYLGPQKQKLLSSCWKDRHVDDARALDLLKLLTKKQSEIFAAIGVEFPSWGGRPLSIKDMAHCLGQYKNYVKIQADMKRQWSDGNHRFLVSKSYLDVSKACRFCDRQTDDGLFCDACLCFYCKDCEAKSCAEGPTCWICGPCTDFDEIQLLD